MTTCLHPPALDAALLLQALDGEADAATTAHLAGCPHCRRALDHLAAAERRLRRRLAGDPCLPRETLAAWADGDLPAAEAVAVAAHSADCAVCRADLAELNAFRAEALAVAEATDRALAALRPERRRAEQGDAPAGPLSGLRRLLAAFQPAQALPAALRSRGSIAAVASSFSADEGRVLVSCVVRPGSLEGRFRLSGRVHGLDLARVEARDSAGQALAAVDLDVHGAFQLPELRGGPLWLRFAGRGLVLELDQPVDLGTVDAA